MFPAEADLEETLPLNSQFNNTIPAIDQNTVNGVFVLFERSISFEIYLNAVLPVFQVTLYFQTEYTIRIIYVLRILTYCLYKEVKRFNFKTSGNFIASEN